MTKLERYRGLQSAALQILEFGLDRIEHKLDQEPARWDADIYDRIFDIGLQLKSGTDRQLGHCNFKDKKIVINYEHPAHRDRAEFKDTILHELAHHIVGVIYGHGREIKSHGKEWKAICRIVGAKPTATYKDMSVPVEVAYAEYTMRMPTEEEYAAHHKG